MSTKGAVGSGECFAATEGGNTIDNGNGGKPGSGVGAAKSLLQVLSQKVTAKKPATKGVAPATAAPHPPQIVKRASYKGRAAAGAKGSRAVAEAAAAGNHKVAKASRKKN